MSLLEYEYYLAPFALKATLEGHFGRRATLQSGYSSRNDGVTPPVHT